jgi:hypothetical protein
MKLVNEGSMVIGGLNKMSLVDASASCVGFNSSFFVLLVMLRGVQRRWAFVLVFPVRSIMHFHSVCWSSVPRGGREGCSIHFVRISKQKCAGLQVG